MDDSVFGWTGRWRTHVRGGSRTRFQSSGTQKLMGCVHVIPFPPRGPGAGAATALGPAAGREKVTRDESQFWSGLVEM